MTTHHKNIDTNENKQYNKRDFVEYCLASFTPIHGDKIKKILNISGDEFRNLITIYNSSDCITRWNKIHKVVTNINYKDSLYDIRFITSFYTTSIQNYMDYKKINNTNA
tara:strand:+ start:1913 stop:2239 length:327 start_codon:yes stop_codon:yes gene_type:complete